MTEQMTREECAALVNEYAECDDWRRRNAIQLALGKAAIRQSGDDWESYKCGHAAAQELLCGALLLGCLKQRQTAVRDFLPVFEMLCCAPNGLWLAELRLPQQETKR